MDYTYKVWREDDKVFYQIRRGEIDVVSPKQMHIVDLSLFAFIMTLGSSEKQIAAMLKKAHKLSKFAIKKLNKYETYNQGG